jgi:putative acetyltransferase
MFCVNSLAPLVHGNDAMQPLYHDPYFTFRFADNRIISRIHLEGVETGRQVAVIKINADTGERQGLLAFSKVAENGWVDLPQSIAVKAGEAFIVAPFLIRAETPIDFGAVWQVNRLAFGQEAEARLVDALRAEGNSRVSLIAESAGKVVGHIMFSDLAIITANGTVAALALAPMAVLPDFQRLGIGSTLVRRGLEACIAQGHRIVVVVGHTSFYPRFGFSATMAEPLESPYGGGPSFMAMELAPGALNGVVGKIVYASPFASIE